MELSETDKMVAATLAAAKLAKEKSEKPETSQTYVSEYHKMLRILARRNEAEVHPLKAKPAA